MKTPTWSNTNILECECLRCYDARHKDTEHNDTQHNDTQHNDTQHNDTQHNDTQNNDTQHNDTQHNDTQHNSIQHSNKLNATLSIMGLIATPSIKAHLLYGKNCAKLVGFKEHKKIFCTLKPANLARFCHSVNAA